MLHTPLSLLPGMLLHHAKALDTQLQLHTYADLLHYYPKRYVRFAAPVPIAQLKAVAYPIQVEGKFHDFQLLGIGKKKRLVAQFSDGTGMLQVVWFHKVNWIKKHFSTTIQWVLHGKITPSQRHSPLQWQLTHPEYYTPSAYASIPKGLHPRYTLPEAFKKIKLTQKIFFAYQQKLWTQLPAALPTDPLPQSLRKKYQLIPLRQALKQVHMPSDTTQLQAAYRRLKFDELLLLQLRLHMLRQQRKRDHKGQVLHNAELFRRFYTQHLPFSLTKAQKRVIKEIHQDLASGQQMNRLLQGDVGSGKTMVALGAILLTIGGGGTATLMAPTTLLAAQHYQKLSRLLQPLDIQPVLLTGNTKAKARTVLQHQLKAGKVPLLIGTHALLEEGAHFKELSLAIIDEQHRFGVAQRAQLWQHYLNPKPHVLVMTATPIPRTLAMTRYGDLDLSILDEMPPGRQPIKTYHYKESKRLRIFQFIRTQLAKGHQVYIIYPLIEASAKADYANLMEGYESICRAFPKTPISIVHGRMKPEAKAYEMKVFAQGKTKIMVATTVIEVGIDVPNASAIIIEEAQRFGLAQLHQLRGRIGRGSSQGYCVLISGEKLTHEAHERLATMVRTSDGFAIAEADLQLRGAGNLMGVQQSGLLALKLADLTKDKKIWETARQALAHIKAIDPELKQEVHSLLREKIQSANWNWVKVG